MDCPEVWARIAVLNGQTQAAELLYLEQNQVDKAVQMYLSLHQWENGEYSSNWKNTNFNKKKYHNGVTTPM